MFDVLSELISRSESYSFRDEKVNKITTLANPSIT